MHQQQAYQKAFAHSSSSGTACACRTHGAYALMRKLSMASMLVIGHPERCETARTRWHGLSMHAPAFTSATAH
jgi:hypothetical protein